MHLSQDHSVEEDLFFSDRVVACDLAAIRIKRERKKPIWYMIDKPLLRFGDWTRLFLLKSATDLVETRKRCAIADLKK